MENEKGGGGEEGEGGGGEGGRGGGGRAQGQGCEGGEGGDGRSEVEEQGCTHRLWQWEKVWGVWARALGAVTAQLYRGKR